MKGIVVFVSDYINLNGAFMAIIDLIGILKGVYFIKIKWVDEVFVRVNNRSLSVSLEGCF